jgi:hypothetical protein
MSFTVSNLGGEEWFKNESGSKMRGYKRMKYGLGKGRGMKGKNY